MRKNNRRNSAKKERIIMIASSGFVLAALTMTGIYMRAQNAEVEDDGYTLDLVEIENSENQHSAVADHNELQENVDGSQLADSTLGIEFEQSGDLDSQAFNMDDAMDFMPLEVGSGNVKIPGLTEEAVETVLGNKEMKDNIAENAVDEGDKQLAVNTEDGATNAELTVQEAAAEKVENLPIIHFAENDGLLRPVSGEVLLPFSMDGSIYFSTLNHYKYNPALMLMAENGTAVAACADGNVVSVAQDAQIGTMVTMDIGDGYQITYGQLKDVTVAVGDYVVEGQTFASVAAPTKYFTLEGSNLYLEVTADGAPVNPEVLFR